MAWQGVLGHDDVAALFERTLAVGRLAHTYLFVGPAGIGKRTFALRLAQTLLCTNSPPAKMSPCGTCASCTMALAGTHPDLLLVAKPADKSFIPLEVFIGPKEKRMREGLCHDLGLKPYLGGRRVAVIDDADFLNEEGANALLKTLEEPPPSSLLILIGTSPARQLPTIRSRSQIVRFRPLADAELVELLVAQGAATTPEEAASVAALGEGSLTLAIERADADAREFRAAFLAALNSEHWIAATLAAQVAAFIDAAGREAPAKRQRCRQAMAIAADFYRQSLRAAAGGEIQADEELRSAVSRPPSADLDTLAACLERTLDAQEQIERNANLATLVECWLDDVAQILRRQCATAPSEQ